MKTKAMPKRMPIAKVPSNPARNPKIAKTGQRPMPPRRGK